MQREQLGDRRHVVHDARRRHLRDEHRRARSGRAGRHDHVHADDHEQRSGRGDERDVHAEHAGRDDVPVVRSRPRAGRARRRPSAAPARSPARRRRWQRARVGAFTLVVNVTGGGTISSTVTGDSDTYDPDPPDNTATRGDDVDRADVRGPQHHEDDGRRPTRRQGSTFSYTIVADEQRSGRGDERRDDGRAAGVAALPLDHRAGGLRPARRPRSARPARSPAPRPRWRTARARRSRSIVEVAASSGSISNTASARRATTTDPNGGNSSATSAGVIAGPAQRGHRDHEDHRRPRRRRPAARVNYTITVTNAGPSPATNVVVTDTLPAGLTLVSATPSQGTCNAVDPVTCNLGTIAERRQRDDRALHAGDRDERHDHRTAPRVTSNRRRRRHVDDAPPIPVGAAAVAADPDDVGVGADDDGDAAGDRRGDEDGM